MASASLGTVLRQLFQQMDARPAGRSTDSGLLAQFVANRNEAAFAELVQRHGPMVLGVCRRILRDPHDADDVFQAAFLVLARKAPTLDGRPLASWLYTVARNLALKHRTAAARRRDHEMEASAMRSTAPSNETVWHEARELLDVELGRLPEKYRAPLVLCHLEGMTHGAAAEALGWSAGSMAKRLTRGRELLRERLASRGVALSATMLVTLIGENAWAAVSPAVVVQMSRAAALYAAGQATADLVSTQATTLASGVVHAFALSRWQAAAALLFGAGILGAGILIFGDRTEKPEVAAVPARAESSAPALAPEDPRDQDLHWKLAQMVGLDRGIDAGTRFKVACEFFAERYHLKIVVDEKAFAVAGVESVQDRLVSLPRMIVPLSSALHLLFRQLEIPDGQVCDYRIEKGTLIVTPVLLENRHERFPRGLPRLFERLRCERAPYDMSLAEAIAVYGKLYGQKLVLDRKTFADVGAPEADKYPLAGRGRDLPDEPCLLEILELILWQVDGDDWKSYFRVRDGAIEITAAKSGSAHALTLAGHQERVHGYQSLWEQTLQLSVNPRRRVTLEKGIEAGTPLADALEYVTFSSDLEIVLDEIGFAGAGIENVREHPVALEPQRGILIQELLHQILGQVGNAEYTARFVFQEGYIAVVPEHNQVRKKQPLAGRHLDKLWDDLAAKHGGRAQLAAHTLVQASRQALPYLKHHVKPIAAKNQDGATRARKLVADLESNEFVIRQKATEELEKLSEAVPVLRERLAGNPPLEVRRRAEQILAKAQDIAPNSEWVRALRIVRVLETIGTVEARQVLQTLAAGEQAAPATRAARAALER